MIQGPPGTGKTRLIGFCVLNCIQRQQPWLLTAETHYAVQVCADRIYADLQAVYGNYDRWTALISTALLSLSLLPTSQTTERRFRS
ncbi:hypothetical protein HO173_009429 [Letharia columbiana]|uniref:DNA2/NAM7 helicase helicase domain-containing protein n=1 Tax=Letharia columbiana TaxID=112416 RepID=A0A8H6L1S2_9LECA|nr:uncharacterized protein HO173_009429 [Letharia columbiana]KAF6232324.1 hypothetical protein HO173_009429 [Letharia columbiana]